MPSEQRKIYLRKWYADNRERLSEKRKKWRQDNPEKITAQNRRHAYGLEPEDYDRMMTEQEGICAICRTRRPTDVDHDHDTGEVRGLLCKHCNRGLGGFQDDPDVLQRAINYLTKSNNQVILYPESEAEDVAPF